MSYRDQSTTKFVILSPMNVRMPLFFEKAHKTQSFDVLKKLVTSYLLIKELKRKILWLIMTGGGGVLAHLE